MSQAQSVASPVDVADFIDAQPVAGFQLRLLLTCAAVLFLDGFDTQAIETSRRFRPFDRHLATHYHVTSLMTKGIDMRAHVAAHGDGVGGGAVSSRSDVFTVLLHQAEQKWRMRWVMRHAYEVGLRQIIDLGGTGETSEVLHVHSN